MTLLFLSEGCEGTSELWFTPPRAWRDQLRYDESFYDATFPAFELDDLPGAIVIGHDERAYLLLDGAS